jgi:hypothetical protein
VRRRSGLRGCHPFGEQGELSVGCHDQRGMMVKILELRRFLRFWSRLSKPGRGIFFCVSTCGETYWGMQCNLSCIEPASSAGEDERAIGETSEHASDDEDGSGFRDDG